MDVVAVIGGGQLARMMAPAAGRLGIRLRALVESGTSSAAQVIADAPVGAPTLETVSALVGDGAVPVDVLTFEHEHVDREILESVLRAGIPVRPGPDALVHAQDKIVMRTRLSALGVPCPRWRALPADDPARSAAELEAFAAGPDEGGTGPSVLAHRPAGDGEVVVKTSRGGYDGKGVRVVSSAVDVEDWIAAAAAEGPALLVEEKVPFLRELAVLVARRPSGEIRTWPVVESVQRGGVCAEVIAPAPGLDPAVADLARDVAVRIAEGLDVTGVLAVELFEVAVEQPGAGPRSTVLVNELAMRPHNSGHWTIDGSVTSQFEQHLRAVLDLPLGDTSPRSRWTVMANVLGSSWDDLAEGLPRVLADDPAARVEIYGKEVRPGRKLAHVNVCGEDLEDVRRRALAAAAVLRGESAER